ncbi:hypothetical protein KJ564_11035 [bacterium]|nr:hypothetical protein [bacterium]MBU1880879.1 hypothetical protein [bacterium]
MKQLSTLVLCCLVVSIAAAQNPNFDYPILLTSADAYIVESQEHVCPAVGDWDDDGDEDLLVGVQYYGYVYFYENISTGSGYEFAPYERLMADGGALTVSWG